MCQALEGDIEDCSELSFLFFHPKDQSIASYLSFNGLQSSSRIYLISHPFTTLSQRTQTSCFTDNGKAKCGALHFLDMKKDKIYMTILGFQSIVLP